MARQPGVRALDGDRRDDRVGLIAAPEDRHGALGDAGSVSTRSLDRVAQAADASHVLLTPSAVATADDVDAVAPNSGVMLEMVARSPMVSARAPSP